MKNDISFVFQFRLYLYEHQSTVNPNIPLRNLLYMSDLLQGMTADENLYSRKRIHIPEPRFVVFYNGKEDQPDRIEYRLSEMYSKESADPDLELRVQVLNINFGHNCELMAGCKTLNEYAQFVRKIRDNRRTMSAEDSVNRAVDDCIREGILRDFLLKNRAEATNVSIYEFDVEQHEKNVRAEGYEDGYEAGREEGREIGREEGREEERVNTEREKKRADQEKARADASEAELARLREKLAALEGRKSSDGDA